MLSKKERVIYWLMGVGCGIMLSGMLMTGVTLKLAEQDKGLSAGQEMQTTIEKEDENQNEEQNDNVDGGKEGEHSDNAGPVESDYIEVNLPSHYYSEAICAALESEGVIEEQEAFLKYLKDNKMTTKLRTGTLYFPINGTNEEVLSVLRGEEVLKIKKNN